MTDSEEDDLLLYARGGPSKPSSATHSRASSRNHSRVGSRRNSSETGQTRFRLSDEEARSGLPNKGKRRSQEDDERILFKVPGDDFERHDHDHDHDHDERSTSAPLLPNGSARRGSTDEGIEELELAEGVPLSFQDSVKGTLLDGIANMANSIMGAGIVGLPYAVAQAGFVTGVLLLVILALITDWTIRLVVINAKLSGRDSYTDVMHHCFGHAGSAAVSFFQFAFAFGGTGDTIPHVIAFIFPALAEHAGLRLLVDRRVIIIICTIAISFPLSLHRDIVKLSKSSGFALVSMGVIVTSVVFRGVAVDSSLRGSALHVFTFIRPGIAEAIGVISFAFVCHHNTMFIYQSIETPTLDRFNAVTHASTGISLMCCLLMAVTGYVVFTDKTQGNILNNFSPDDFVINIARFCLGANMSTTVPLENYVCREVIEDFFFAEKPFSQRRHVIVTSLIVLSAMGISLLTCDLGVVLEIAGGVSATALAFIFPASAYVTLIRGPWYSRQKLPAVLCATFGALVLVLSLGLTIKKTVSGENRGKVCT